MSKHTPGPWEVTPEALKEADGEMTALFNAMSDEQKQTYGPMYAPVAGKVWAVIARAEG